MVPCRLVYPLQALHECVSGRNRLYRLAGLGHRPEIGQAAFQSAKLGGDPCIRFIRILPAGNVGLLGRAEIGQDDYQRPGQRVVGTGGVVFDVTLPLGVE